MVVFNSHPVTQFKDDKPESHTAALRHELPRLPIPTLEETCCRYLNALEGLQDQKEHARTKVVVEDFLRNDGPKWQEHLSKYAADKAR